MNLDGMDNIHAEQAVIGAAFLDNKILDQIADKLQPGDFSIMAHELLWKGIKYLYGRGKGIDLVTMTSVLQQYNRLEEIGGVTYLAKLANSTPTVHNAVHYAEIVRSRAFRRRAIDMAQRITEMAHDLETDDGEFYSQVEKMTAAIHPQTDGEMKSLAESREEFFEFLESKDDFINSGFKAFDEWMGGLGRGWLYILAGRPSVGKTAKALQLSRGIAEQQKGDVLIWSQEMKRNQLIARMISPESGVNGSRIRRKELEPFEKEKIREAYDRLENLPMHIFDARNVTIEEIRAYARQHKRKYGQIAAIVVDYLTIMKIIQHKGETRSQAVGYVTRTAKQVALELDCVFIMLAQLSREGVGDPKLEHLRDSGEIEQDADVVEFLWHNPDETDQKGKVIQSIIAKGRDVGTNHFRYLFKGWIQKYEEYNA